MDNFFPVGFGGGITDLQTIKTPGTYALDARQNNPDVDGSLRQVINKLYDMIYYGKGDSTPTARISVGGTLTNSGTQLQFMIPFSFATDATPKLNMKALQVRYQQGYLLGDANTAWNTMPDMTGIEIVVEIYKSQGLFVALTKDSPYVPNVNNVPVAVACWYSIDFV